MTDEELIIFVKSLRSSLIYCAPEAVEDLLFDKLRPHLVGPSRRVAELEARNTQQMLSISALTTSHKENSEALKASQQCIADFLDVYGRGCSMLVLDEAVKSLRDDALPLVKRCLTKIETRSEQGWHGE